MSYLFKFLLIACVAVLFVSTNTHAYNKQTKTQILDDVIKTCPDGLATFLSKNRSTIAGKLTDSPDVKDLKDFNLEESFLALVAKIRNRQNDPYNAILRLSNSMNDISDYINPGSNYKKRTVCKSVTAPYLFEYDGFNDVSDTKGLISNIETIVGKDRCYKKLSSNSNDIVYATTVNALSDYLISAWFKAVEGQGDVKPKFQIVRAELKPAPKNATTKGYDNLASSQALRNTRFYNIDQIPAGAEITFHPDENSTSTRRTTDPEAENEVAGERNNSTRDVDLLGISGHYENRKVEVMFFYKNTDRDELIQWRTGSVETSCQIYKNTGDILRPVRGAQIATNRKVVKSSFQKVYIDIPGGYADSNEYEILECQVDTGWSELSAVDTVNFKERY